MKNGKNGKNVKKYSKNEFIKNVADKSSVNVMMVEIIMKTIEDVITEKLRSADSDNDVSVKLFDGFYVDGTYIPSKTKKNNLTGKNIDVCSKIKIKTKITKVYTEKVNQ